MRNVVFIATLVSWGLAGCGGSTPASELAKAPEFNPEGQTKCSIAASQARPLIVEWPSTDRGDLEAAARKGVVAVRYSGCEMEVLRRCAVEAAYGYTPFTRKDDRISIRDADELYANVPMGAVKLEGKLEKAGQLTVTMTAVGKLEAQLRRENPPSMQGDCADATHLVTGVTVGAFEFYAGADAEVGAGVDVMGAGAGAKSVASRELLNRDGSRERCGSATNQDEDPPDGCGAFLRLEVTPLSDVMGHARTAKVHKTSTKESAPSPKPTVSVEPAAAVAGTFGGELLTFARGRSGELYLRSGSGWSAQGITSQAVPALAANRSGRTSALVVDRAGKLRLRTARRGSWTGAGTWSTVASAGTVHGAVALVATSKDVLAAFARTPTGRLTHLWQTKPGSDAWSKPLDLGGTLRTDPVALTDGEGRLVALALSPGGEIQLISQARAYGPWGDWMSLGTADSSPAPVATSDGVAVVAVRKGKLAVTRRTGLGGWRDWEPLVTTPSIADPRTVAVSRFGAPTMLVIQDGAGALHWGSYEPGSSGERRELELGRVPTDLAESRVDLTRMNVGKMREVIRAFRNGASIGDNPYAVRYTVTHDLHHVLTGFDTGLAGEVGVVGFTVGQGTAPMGRVGMALVRHLYPWVSPSQAAATRHNYDLGVRMGERAKLVLAEPLESWLADPLVDVRARLGIDEGLIAKVQLSGHSWIAEKMYASANRLPDAGVVPG